uniref:30S ribosomal protein S3 n=1 Tax=uncultured organism TaxID=155900 RepID=U3GR31_9ZZZZ|nr:30S ribosomal protein S3 [uncultured organism]
MGQKVNPTGFRIGTFLPWKSRWFADNNSFKQFLIEDIRIRKELTKKLKLAGITGVEIERSPKSIVVTITVSRPGRAVQKAIERVMASGALGIKVVLAGRINGAEISRVEKFHQGSVPSQTLRVEIRFHSETMQ